MKRMEGKSTGKKAKLVGGIDDEEDDEDPEPVLEPLAINYIGCYGGDDDFGGKEYIGSASGANIRLLHSIAKEKKKYIAIARVGSDGHSFVFDEKPGRSVPVLKDRGCERSGVDDINYKCGCADANCDGVGKAPGEEHLRRWVVYEMTDSAPKATGGKTKKVTKEEKKKKEEEEKGRSAKERRRKRRRK